VLLVVLLRKPEGENHEYNGGVTDKINHCLKFLCLVYNININVCNYANEPMNKHTFGTQSQGLFLACR
jgi:hypothetical protein